MHGYRLIILSLVLCFSFSGGNYAEANENASVVEPDNAQQPVIEEKPVAPVVVEPCKCEPGEIKPADDEDKIPAEFVMGFSMGYLPYPGYHALVPTLSLGPHWDYDGPLDLRLLFEVGPTIVPKGSHNIRLQIFAITEFFLDYSPFYIAPSAGLGGGVYEYLDGEKGDNCSGAKTEAFLAIFFLSFGAGYTNGNWSVGPSARLYIGQGAIEEYCITDQGEVIEDYEAQNYFAISAQLDLRYAW